MMRCGIYQVRMCIHDLEGFLKRIQDISRRNDAHVILFNAMNMAGKAHTESALHHAFRALDQGSMISSRVEVESLLYAAGSRQIVHGTRFGVQKGENAAYLCICPDNASARRELMKFCSPADHEDWDSITPAKAACLCELFSITPQEAEVVGPGRIRELVLERVALLEVYR